MNPKLLIDPATWLENEMSQQLLPGPILKFKLLKQFGDALRAAGHQNESLQRMSCNELLRAIDTLQ